MENEAFRLKAKIEEKKNAQLQLTANLETLTADISNRRKSYLERKAAFDAEMAELLETIRVDNEKIVFFKKKLRELNAEIDALERLLKIELDKLKQSSMWIENTIKFDQVTKDLEWRKSIKPLQLEGAQIIGNNRRVLLADPMGQGKTLTMIASLDMLQAQKVLVLAPTEVLSTIQEEFARWAPHRAVINLQGTPLQGRKVFLEHVMPTLSSYVLLLNYEAWRKDTNYIDRLKYLCFDTVVMDEAHNIKNTKGVAFKGIRDIIMAENVCPRCNSRTSDVEISRYTFTVACTSCTWDRRSSFQYKDEDVRSIKNVIPMTGTPVLNRPQELYPLLHCIMPSIFAKEFDFLDTYCEIDLYTGYWRFRPGGLDRLSNSLRGRYICRKAEVTWALPDKNYLIPIDEVKDNYPQQFKVMEQLRKHSEIMLTSGEKLQAIVTIALITRQRQANVCPAGIQVKDPLTKEIIFNVGDEIQESIKLDKAFELCQTITQDGNWERGERVVVFSQFKMGLHILRDRLNTAGINAVVYDGETPHDLRLAIKTDFNRVTCDVPGYIKQWQVVLCNYRTGGVGLTLTGATHMIVLDKEWNPGKQNQAHGRIDRIGQIKATQVHILHIEKTVDTWLNKLLEHKENVVSGFEDTTDDLAKQYLDELMNESWS
jgi:SNF2 family DNA or RNA helicase